MFELPTPQIDSSLVLMQKKKISSRRAEDITDCVAIKLIQF